MKIARALLASVLCLALTACSVTVKPPIEIKGGGGGNGNFCPPGQAKKGNC